jgi:5-(carboxyamino)imidazole ribonucleotide synthase
MHIGILGSGQLGRMLALAGKELGHSFSFFDEAPSSATAGLGDTNVGEFTDRLALRGFAAHCDVITYEFENVPYDTARFLAGIKPVYPPPQALQVSQDRLTEKEFLQGLGIGTPRFQAASSLSELEAACRTLGYPCIAKTRRFGYDGKGQYRLNSKEDLKSAWSALLGVPLLVEGFVPFSRELSVIATRDQKGSIAYYPLSFNLHINGILHRSEIPAPELPASVRDLATSAITKVLNKLEYVGTLAIELFEVRGEILANEIAPRVHNSGHATIEGVSTSQFSNHIRAITGDILGATEPISRAVMYNIIGKVPDTSRVTTLPNFHLHVYNKSERAGRKLGHITLINPSQIEEDEVNFLCSR